jgi:hypothetical protein
MITQPDLRSLYEEWRHLTETEGEAISHSQWQEVTHHQALKEELKERIIVAAQEWQEAWPEAEVGRREYERQFRPIVSELITMESHNHECLCRQRQKLQAQLEHLNRTTRSLHGVRCAYGAPTSSHWQSYS